MSLNQQCINSPDDHFFSCRHFDSRGSRGSFEWIVWLMKPIKLSPTLTFPTAYRSGSKSLYQSTRTERGKHGIKNSTLMWMLWDFNCLTQRISRSNYSGIRETIDWAKSNIFEKGPIYLNFHKQNRERKKNMLLGSEKQNICLQLTICM